MAAASVLAVAPVTPWLPAMSALNRAVRLTAGDSLMNVPMNLLQDFYNIPYYEVQGANVLASSLFWTGNWFTPSATNIWGEDPGDPGHFMGLTDMAIPFPEISGVDQPELDPTALSNGTAGLGQQLAMLAAVALPVSSSCDAINCGTDVASMVPTYPNATGFTGIDRALNFLTTSSGANQLPMFANWYKPEPLTQMLQPGGYTFATGPDTPGNAIAAGIVNPDAGVGAGGSVPTVVNGVSMPSAPVDPGTGLINYGAIPGQDPAQDGFGFPGTIQGATGENLMPWAGINFQFNPLGPIQSWSDSLMAPVDMNGFHSLDPNAPMQALQALAAGMIIDFNTKIAGSPACLGMCPDANTVDLVTQINHWTSTTNPLINTWLAQNAANEANAATIPQVHAAIAGLQTGDFTFSADQTNQILSFLNDIGGPNLARLAVNSGTLTDPGFLGPWQTGDLTGEHGGFIPPGIAPDGSVIPADGPFNVAGDVAGSEYGGYNTTAALVDFFNLLGGPQGTLGNELADMFPASSAADMVSLF